MKKLLGILVFLLVFGLTGRAGATILWAGNEDIDFAALVNAAEDCCSDNNRAYSRGNIVAGGFGDWNDNGNPTSSTPPTNYALTPTFTSSTSLWVHGYNSEGNSNSVLTSSGNGWELLALYSPDGYPRIAIGYPNGTATGSQINQYSIYTIDNTGTYTLLATQSSAYSSNPICGTQTTTFDVYVNYGTSGTVTLYCNSVQAVTYSGNVTTNSATTLNQVRFAGINAWSEMIVSTTPTLAMHLLCLAPAANGNADTFTTGNVSNINEFTLDTTTVDASGTAGQIQEYTVVPSTWSDWSAFGSSANVLAVVMHASALVNSTGPQHLQAMVRTGGTDYTSSNLSPNQYSWTHISNIWATNPNTSANWTLGDLSNAGFNIGFKSAN